MDSDLRRYLTSSGVNSGKLQGNPKLHKPGMPLRTIVNGRNHPTEKMAEKVENELCDHVTVVCERHNRLSKQNSTYTAAVTRRYHHILFGCEGSLPQRTKRRGPCCSN
ncbi:hypothetical protein DPMN_128177 [Dreissena polymorpha]|uniref:Uncharacterized protein n=1 Tax=Dreissena polymorpha TaxID=45954 RepID=A0A9D4JVI0_DREPO|nr:hypothetical protein DPMN_128177 [Dreissena polymorpha]